MRTKLTLLPCAPTGRQRSAAFVARECAHGDGDEHGEPGVRCSLEVSEVDVYPRTEESRRLHAMRLAANMSLRDLSRLLDLGLVETSKLERGEVTLPADQWAAVFSAMAPPAARPEETPT